MGRVMVNPSPNPAVYNTTTANGNDNNTDDSNVCGNHDSMIDRWMD